MNAGKVLAPSMTLATTVAGAIGVFDPSIPPSVRTGLGAAAAVVIAAYVLGHHLLEASKVSAGATVAAAKHQSTATAIRDDAQRALAGLGPMFDSVFGGAKAPSTGPSPAIPPAGNAGGGPTPPTPGGQTP